MIHVVLVEGHVFSSMRAKLYSDIRYVVAGITDKVKPPTPVRFDHSTPAKDILMVSYLVSQKLSHGIRQVVDSPECCEFFSWKETIVIES